MTAALAVPEPPAGVRLLLDGRDPRAAEGWQPLHDRVMGGQSGGRVVWDGSLAFCGTVSLAHGGGFASWRHPLPAAGLAACGGLQVAVRGDGRRCALNLRHADDDTACNWQVSWQAPADHWAVVSWPWSAFVARRRGQIVHDAAALRPQALATVGVMIGERQAGDFQLRIGWLAAWPLAAGGQP